MIRTDKFTIAILFIIISFMGTVISLKAAEAQEETAKKEIPEANKIEYKAEDLRDPFQGEEKTRIQEEPKEVVPAKPLPSLQIEGLVWGGGFPQAIINNKVVRVGDTIGEVRVEAIDKGGVTVSFDNRQFNLTTSLSSPQGVIMNPQGR